MSENYKTKVSGDNTSSSDKLEALLKNFELEEVKPYLEGKEKLHLYIAL